jgi:hypothetical protein
MGIYLGDAPETTEVSPVQIVTIKNKTPLFKGEEQANAIEKIEIEENGFSLVAQKDLYKIGDKAVYIQPDYSLSDISLFDSFIRPFGDPKKSKLGSNFRIRAVKFNLHTGNNEPTYSVGILLPIEDVVKYLQKDDYTDDDLIHFYHHYGPGSGRNLVKELGITKWEEPDNSGGIKTGSGRSFPSDMYKTDETNINNLWGHLEKKVSYPVRLIGSEKVDGSSISIVLKNGQFSVASRTYMKPERIDKVVGRRNPSIWERIRSVFGYKPDLLIKENVENDDEFVQLAKPYIEKIKQAYGPNIGDVKVIFRGEANGQKWKGSGNKNNPTSKEQPNIKFYGVDNYESVATKMGEDNFAGILALTGLERCKVVFDKVFESREEIEKACKEHFKKNMIEGIVLRTADSKFSGKFMNDYYDSFK